MKTLVIGAAKSGVAAANFLAGRGEAVVIADRSAEPSLPFELDPAVERAFGREDVALLDGVEQVVLSPGVPRAISLVEEALSRDIPVIGEIELAFRHLSGRVVGITGSNGKSTTTALIGEILREAGREPIVAGNIGDPLIAQLDPDSPRTYILELSSFQLESIERFRAHVALLLNITPDHMDRYETLEHYAAAKYRIFRNQHSGDTAIINETERRRFEWTEGVRVWRFSASQPVEEGAWYDGSDLRLSIEGQESRIAREALALQGNANVENALAAWLGARACEVNDDAVERAFRSFRGLPHRMVLVRELDGVRWINDSKGTNVDATLKALEGFGDREVVLILGGRDKHGEFERMKAPVSKKARAVLLIGEAAEPISQALGDEPEIIRAETMQRAVEWARENARTGETVMLSPACASFDQYRNFEHRGEHFEELVRGLR
jgi:UDP-N-acetylmuramoylalanine--D-glutamate ligase